MKDVDEDAGIGVKVREALNHDLTGVIYTDHSELSYRLDGNNVDINTENVELASNQIQYQYLLKCISQEFKDIQTVLK